MNDFNVGWGLTSNCNSKCKHCYNNSSSIKFNNISFEESKSIVDKFCDNNVKTVNYGTGESGLVDYFWDLVQYSYNKGLLQGLTTNGSSVNENTIGYIKKYMNDIDVSLDYPTKSKNNDFRGSHLAWDWAINAAKILKENCINFSFVTCLHSKNCETSVVDDFLDICKSYDCEWRINWFKPTGRGKLNSALKLDPKKVHEIFRYIIGKTTITALPDPYFSAILGINDRKEAKGCPCGQNSFRVTPNSEVVPCVYFTDEMKSLSILKYDFKTILKSKCMLLSQNRKIDFCDSCEYFGTCRGGCFSRSYLEYKDINFPDAFCFKKNGIIDNPLRGCYFDYEPKTDKVHQNYLCTLIVSPR